MKQKNALVRKIVLEASRPEDIHPLAQKIAALTGGKPSTIKLELKELVAKGYLVAQGTGAWGVFCADCFLMKTSHPSSRKSERPARCDRNQGFKALVVRL